MALNSGKSKKSVFGNINPDQMLSSASGIVLKAANILEKNIAEGIIAAGKVEKKYVDTEKLRSNKEDVMNRFRKDSHEALDIFFDALNMATLSLQELAEKAQTVPPVRSDPSGKNVPVLSVDEPLAPGSDASIPLTLENESDTDVMELEFFDQGLRLNDENIIHKKNIIFEPRILTLKPREKGVIMIRIHIPKSAAPGTYSGFVREKNLAGLEAIVRLQVSEQ